jgi:hypothetical protein
MFDPKELKRHIDPQITQIGRFCATGVPPNNLRESA